MWRDVLSNDVEDVRDDWIRHLVAGRSFADVGGLWGTVNEKISVADRAGSSEATMIDIQPDGNQWWKKFYDRLDFLGVKRCRSIIADATKENFESLAGNYDLVHCSGVLYHLPSPYGLIRNLSLIANEYIILTSITVPEKIENSEGVINLSGGKALFCPSLTTHQARIVSTHFWNLGIDPENITAVKPDDWMTETGEPNYTNWWFLMTRNFISSLAGTLHLEIVDVADVWKGRSTAFLLKKR